MFRVQELLMSFRMPFPKTSHHFQNPNCFKAAFQLRVFHTHVYARKNLNLSKFYSSSDNFNKYK